MAGRRERLATPDLLAPDAALVRLCDPGALERFTCLGPEAPLAVDLRGVTTPSSVSRWEPARRGLAMLPCPSVAWVAKDEDRTGPPAAWFDVAVTTDALLHEVAEKVRRHPLASLALVQLLRLSEGRTLHDGLVAESLVYSTLQSGPEFQEWLARRPPPKARPAPEGDAVRVDRDGARLTLTLNRPEKRNAFSTAMRDALCEALTVALADDSIAEVVLEGAGPAFCSGGDLDEFGTLPDPATAHAVRATRNPARLLAACAPRVHARVHGACVGAGVELPAFADRVTAKQDAGFQLPEVSMGLVPGAGGTASLPRRIGRQRTAWLALTGSTLDAGTALAWGLVDEVTT